MCKHNNSTVTECKLCEHEHWIEIVENRNRFLVSRNKKHKNKIQELEAKVKEQKDAIDLFRMASQTLLHANEIYEKSVKKEG